MSNISIVRAVALAGFMAAMFLAAGGCISKLYEDKKSKEPVPIRSAVAEVRKLQPTFELIGTVIADPEKFASLTAPAPGLVQKLCIAEGTMVKANTLIIQLDDREAKNALAQAEAAYAKLVAKPRPEELVQAEGNVNKLKAAYDAALARFNKTKESRERDPRSVPEVPWLDEKQKEQAALADWKSADASLQLLKQGPRKEVLDEANVLLQRARLGVEFCRVVAPFDGEIVDIHAHVGQRADPGMPLATIIDNSTVLVQARVPADRLAIVEDILRRNDNLGDISSPSYPTSLPIDSGWLSQQTEALSGDLPLRLRVGRNLGRSMRVGMSVRVKLNAPPVEALAIPEKALSINDDGEYVVTVVKDGKAVPTNVDLAGEGEHDVRAEGFVRITRGLVAGDRVAIENGLQLPKDTPVTEMPEKKKEEE